MLGKHKTQPHHRIRKEEISAPVNTSLQDNGSTGGGGAGLDPFTELHFEASASIAGGPMDPRVRRANLPPPKLSHMQLQALIQAVGAFRRQVQAMSAASETLVRCLEDLTEVVPSSN
jgi:hypothetical protein